jgi:protein SCO1
MDPTTVAPTPAPPVARRWRFSPGTVALTVITVLVGVYTLWLQFAPRAGDTGKYYGQWIGKDAADFTLTDQDGKRMSLSDLRGNAVLMTFGFTHCPNVCPTTLANLSSIYRSLPAAAQQKVKVVFISVDPARDTPKAMKDYVGFYGPTFIGLTGSSDEIAGVAKDYGAYYKEELQDSPVAGDYYTVTHSTYVYMIDPQGRFALLYNNDKLLDHGRMAGDIQQILAK